MTGKGHEERRGEERRATGSREEIRAFSLAQNSTTGSLSTFLPAFSRRRRRRRVSLTSHGLHGTTTEGALRFGRYKYPPRVSLANYVASRLTPRITSRARAHSSSPLRSSQLDFLLAARARAHPKQRRATTLIKKFSSARAGNLVSRAASAIRETFQRKITARSIRA